MDLMKSVGYTKPHLNSASVCDDCLIKYVTYFFFIISHGQAVWSPLKEKWTGFSVMLLLLCILAVCLYHWQYFPVSESSTNSFHTLLLFCNCLTTSCISQQGKNFWEITVMTRKRKRKWWWWRRSRWWRGGGGRASGGGGGGEVGG